MKSTKEESRLNKETVQGSRRRDETPAVMLFGILPCSPNKKQILFSCLMPSAFSLGTRLSALRIIERFRLDETSGPRYSSGHGQLHSEIRLLQAPSKRVLKISEDGDITNLSGHLFQYWTTLLHEIFLPKSSISFFTKESWDYKSACNLLIEQLHHAPSMIFTVQITQFEQWPASSYFLFFSVSPWQSGATWEIPHKQTKNQHILLPSLLLESVNKWQFTQTLPDPRIIHPVKQLQDSFREERIRKKVLSPMKHGSHF